MKFNRRYEHKYRIDLFTYYKIKMYLKPYINNDNFTGKTKNGKYLVRSLYFDNDSLEAFFEKENGNWGRIKFRIRSYKEKVEDTDVLNFELKTKKGNLMGKYSQFISVKDYKLFMEGKYIIPPNNKFMTEVERLRGVRKLKPILIVEYEREGFVSKVKEEKTRITFDHNIKYARSNELFPSFLNYRKRIENDIILEIKNQKELPIWLSKMIKMYQLKEISNSKFTYGMMAINNDIITINKNKKMMLGIEKSKRIKEPISESDFKSEVAKVDEVKC